MIILVLTASSRPQFLKALHFGLASCFENEGKRAIYEKIRLLERSGFFEFVKPEGVFSLAEQEAMLAVFKEQRLRLRLFPFKQDFHPFGESGLHLHGNGDIKAEMDAVFLLFVGDFDFAARGVKRTGGLVQGRGEDRLDADFVFVDVVDLDAEEVTVEDAVVGAEHRMVEGVHGRLVFLFPSFPDRGGIVGQHEAPAGVFGVFEDL